MKGFEGKVTLVKVHAEGGNFLNFKFTREFCGEDDERIADTKRVLADVLNNLETAFSGRFADFAAIEDVCCFFASPFTAEPAIAKHCRKRLLSTKQRCRTISSISRWCQDKKICLMLRKTISCFSGQRKCLCDFQC